MVLIKNKDFTIKLNRYKKILYIYPVTYNGKKCFVRLRTYIFARTGFIKIYNYKKRKGILKLFGYKGRHLYTFCTSSDLFEAVFECNKKHISTLLPETLEDIFNDVEKIKAEKQKIIEWNGVVGHIENAATNNIL